MTKVYADGQWHVLIVDEDGVCLEPADDEEEAGDHG
jgi:hypothetical protein